MAAEKNFLARHWARDWRDNENNSTQDYKHTNRRVYPPPPYATEESDLERADGICRATKEESRQAPKERKKTDNPRDKRRAQGTVSADFLLASNNLSQTGDATGQGVCGELGLRAEGFALQHSLGDAALYSGL